MEAWKSREESQERSDQLCRMLLTDLVRWFNKDSKRWPREQERSGSGGGTPNSAEWVKWKQWVHTGEYRGAYRGWNGRHPSPGSICAGLLRSHTAPGTLRTQPWRRRSSSRTRSWLFRSMKYSIMMRFWNEISAERSLRVSGLPPH